MSWLDEHPILGVVVVGAGIWAVVGLMLGPAAGWNEELKRAFMSYALAAVVMLLAALVDEVRG